MWEILRCKKWPGPREVFILLGTTNHDTRIFFFVFFLLGDFWGSGSMVILGDFFFGGVIFVFNQGWKNLNG